MACQMGTHPARCPNITDLLSIFPAIFNILLQWNQKCKREIWPVLKKIGALPPFSPAFAACFLDV
jgi:hypothetical protein